VASTDGHDKQIVSRLVDLQSPAKRCAIRALGRRKALVGAAVVADALQSSDLPIVVAAIESLAEMKAAGTTSKVRALLHHEHPTADMVSSLIAQLGAGYPPLNTAARNALIAAALNQIPSATEAAVRLLTDPDPRRREDGSFILGGIGSDAALEQHIQLLQET